MRVIVELNECDPELRQGLAESCEIQETLSKLAEDDDAVVRS